MLHTHCGCCSQCLDRRFAVLAAHAADHDPVEMYKVELVGEKLKQAGLLGVSDDTILRAAGRRK
jgi:hypothetical protein